MSDETNLPAEADPQLPARRSVRAGAEVRAGAPVAALVPRTIEEAWRLAVAISRSGLAPKDMRRPEQVLVAIMAGAEIGLPPFQAVQSIAVINSRPTLWGDSLLAVVQARGVRLKEWFENEGDDLTAFCTVTRPEADEEPVTRSFSVADAKTAGLWMRKGSQGQDTPWVTYPKRMLQMRARSWCVRDSCSDIVRGIVVREEALDAEFTEVTPSEEAPSVSAFLDADIAADDGSKIEVADAPEPEPEPEQVAEPEVVTDAPEPEQVNLKAQPSGFSPTLKWVAQVREAFEATLTRVDLEALRSRWNNDANLTARAELAKADPKMAMMLESEFAALHARISPEETK
jgi:hypothetical protein